MGVHNLWELLLPIGRRISIESLEGQILAIDASIWLTQFLTIQQKMAEKDGETTGGSGGTTYNTRVHYLANTLKRLCKLRFQGIRPVLVFDGATPEIKKREIRERQRKKKRKHETFLGDDTAEAVQRAAKRLLAKQLLKGAGGKLMLKTGQQKQQDGVEEKKTDINRDDDSDGFYDPEAEKREKQKQEALAAKFKAEEEQNAAIREREQQELNELLKNDDYLNDATDGFQESQNDWDIGVSTSSTAGDAKDDSDDNNSNRNNSQNPFRPNRRPGQPKQDKVVINFSDFHAGDGTRFAITDVARLDPTLRKDVVEHAQKNRYLASRREYLQQAYDPEGLSQTQLRNFLKSTKLNQDIAKMAKQAAKLQERDKALKKEQRIIFEKDESDDNNDVEEFTASLKQRPKPTAKQKQEQLERLKKQKLSLLQDTDDEQDETDKVHEDQADAFQEGQQKHRGDNYFRNAVVDDDDQDDSLASEIDGNGGGGFFVPMSSPVNRNAKLVPKTTTSPSRKIRIQDHDSDENDDEIKVWKDGDASGQNETRPDAILAQEIEDEALARAVQDAEEDDVENGGGFLPNQSKQGRVQAQQVAISIDDVDVSQVHDIEDDRKRAAQVDFGPHKLEQELEDEGLAKSLQVMEYGEDLDGGGFLPKVHPTHHDDSKNAEVLQNHTSNDENDNEEEEEEDVDCEDGGEEKADEPTASGSLNPSSRRSNNDVDEQESDEDAVEWEDGNDERIAAFNEQRLSNYDEEARSSADADDEGGDSDLEFEAHDNSTFQTDDWGVTAVASSKTEKELLTALEQAQATAANLTNWAGRAFRRAVADHAAEQGLQVPDIAKPKAITSVASTTTTTAVTTATEVDSNKFVTASGAKKEKSSPVVSSSLFPRKPKPTITSTLAPAFDFLDTIGTEHAYSTVDSSTAVVVMEPSSDTTMIPGGTASEELRTEVMQLLQLFGIPYVVAPAEAEAQCVELERLGLVNGIVTDDSDAFVFGASIVYKNLFKDQKFVEAYYAKDAVSEMSLNRDALVALAMLMGGDYTEGIKGVGLVNAMEILDAFDVADNCKDGLMRFRKWLDGFDPSDLVAGGSSGKDATGIVASSTSEHEFHQKHRTARTRWIAPTNFPDDRVFNAYWNPVVDNSRDKFSWGVPNVQGLTVFCQQHLGWPPEETQTLIAPILERLQSTNGTMRQTRLDSFLMKYEDDLKFATIRSKRLQTVLKKNAKKKKPPLAEGEEEEK
ncbi:flap endonuclease-1 [Nitzschia inconspicua]|uniref:Flap endonuclease-1 n=1 Tax=Nitzschia inconspicua TaxID=303405 RepID=A0A9K3L904_9STRA|nr:flap endonuclease-1 [Nitzschia inconspicua]